MKIAVVTGTSYGLGRDIAKALLKEGFKVYGISRTKSEIDDKNFIWIKVDLTKDGDLDNILTSIGEKKIDLLVNNAGMAFLKPANEFTNADFDRTFGLNFVAPIKLTSLLLTRLANGLVINMSSDSDRFAEKNLGLYSASKAALNIYFDALTLENPEIKVINILSSTIDTPLTRKMNYEGFKDESDWENYMRPEKVARAVVYFVQNHKEFSTSTRAIVLSNYFQGDAEDPEILFSYNTDTEEVKKLK